MNLETLKSILEHHFAPPFVKEGTVKVEWDNESKTVLSITIGPRDIQIDEDGNIIGAGTWFD